MSKYFYFIILLFLCSCATEPVETYNSEKLNQYARDGNTPMVKKMLKKKTENKGGGRKYRDKVIEAGRNI